MSEEIGYKTRVGSKIKFVGNDFNGNPADESGCIPMPVIFNFGSKKMSKSGSPYFFINQGLVLESALNSIGNRVLLIAYLDKDKNIVKIPFNEDDVDLIHNHYADFSFDDDVPTTIFDVPKTIFDLSSYERLSDGAKYHVGDEISFVGEYPRIERYYCDESIYPEETIHGSVNLRENKGTIVSIIFREKNESYGVVVPDDEIPDDECIAIVEYIDENGNTVRLGFDFNDLNVIKSNSGQANVEYTVTYKKIYKVSYVNLQGETVKTELHAENEDDAISKLEDAASINYVMG